MSTNQVGTIETIKAVASLWPLVLIVFLTFFLVVVLIFFRPQVRTLLDSLKNLVVKWGKAEVALNQSQSPMPPSEEKVKTQEAAAAKPMEKDAGPQDSPKQRELDLDPELLPFYHLLDGNMDEADKAFEKYQSGTTDVVTKLCTEANYLRHRFERGDQSAQHKIQALEFRAKDFPKALGAIKRADAQCYFFSRNYKKAAERFEESAKSCVTEIGKAESLTLAASSMHEHGLKAEALKFLCDSLTEVESADAKAAILGALADLYLKDGKKWERALALQRATAYQPNAKDLAFRTGYACADATMNDLAVLHYERVKGIDPKHSSALNNLAVAYAALEAPSLAVENYKRAIASDETLASANLANILVGVGELEEAEKLLKEAQTKKNVHENVADALVGLQQRRKADHEKREEILKRSQTEYQFMLKFTDAFFSRVRLELAPDGIWKSDDVNSVSLKLADGTRDLELVWTEAAHPLLNGEKFRFVGRLNGWSAKGDLEKWTKTTYLFLDQKTEGKFESVGIGYAFFSEEGRTLTLFAMPSKEGAYRTIIFRREAAA